MRNCFYILCFAATLFSALPAQAQWGGMFLQFGGINGVGFDRDIEVIRIGQNDRRDLQNYLLQQCREKQSCRPPAKNEIYNRGSSLPHDAPYARLPAELTRHLDITPPGTIYVQVGDVVYLARNINKVILDYVALPATK